MKLLKLKLKKSKSPKTKQLRITVSPFFKPLILSSGIVSTGDIIRSYNVGVATVYLINDKGRILYIVDEPKVTSEVEYAYNQIMDYVSFKLKASENIESLLKNIIWEAAEELGIYDIVNTHYKVLEYYILRDVAGYGILDVPLRDPDVEDISIESAGVPAGIVHRRVASYRWINSNIVFPSEDHLRRYIVKLAQKAGTSVSTAYPVREFRLPEGHRVIVNFGYEVTGRGSSLTIRKFPQDPLTLVYLVKDNMLSSTMAAYLWLILEALGFIIIIGSMGSGKTTLLQSLLMLAPPDAKIVTIEDTPEIRLPHERWKSYYVKRGLSLSEFKIEIGLGDLLKAALRERAEYVCVGEARGREVIYLFQAASVGSGSVTTWHADSPEQMITRMKTLGITDDLFQNIWCIVLTKKVRLQGRWVRRITNIYEVQPSSEGYSVVEVFHWNSHGDSFNTLDNPTYRLTLAARRLCIDDVMEELEYRREFIESLVISDKLDYKSLVTFLHDFYRMRI